MDLKHKKHLKIDDLSLYDMFAALHIFSQPKEQIMQNMKEFEKQTGRPYLKALNEQDRLVHFDMKQHVEIHIQSVSEKFYKAYRELIATQKE